jgi:hypothetical protein
MACRNSDGWRRSTFRLSRQNPLRSPVERDLGPDVWKKEQERRLGKAISLPDNAADRSPASLRALQALMIAQYARRR